MELNLRSYQESAIDGLRKGFMAGHRAQILYLPTGGGKCLGYNTPILMADGTIKPVQDIKTGDMLASPFGLPKTVLSTCSGQDHLYMVIPTKGDSYIVNSEHILSLKYTGTGEIKNISIGDYDKLSNNQKYLLKGWRHWINEFDNECNELPIPPYILGIWLGDGHHTQPIISKPIGVVTDEWIAYGYSLGLNYSIDNGNSCPSIRLTNGRFNNGNPFTNKLRELNLEGNKHIPSIYKTSSFKNRLELIAGFLDTDGHLHRSGYDWINKDEQVANDFAFMCRSVGLAAYVQKCRKGIKSTGYYNDYWRVGISGDCSIIPCKVKIVDKRKQIKNVLVTGIKIEPIGWGNYYGFQLDGDKLFMLGDFTVTHNTECAISMLQHASSKGNPTAFVMDRRILVDQTSARVGKYGIEHGVLMAKHPLWRPEKKIQVCSIQTLEAKGSFPAMKLLVIDEAHCCRKSVTEFISNYPDVRVVGLSASPFTTGLGKIYTNVVNGATTKELVDMGMLSPMRVFIAKEIDMTGAKKVGGEWSDREATQRGIKITGDIIDEWEKKTMELFGKPEKTIVFCAGVAHGNDIAAKFYDRGYNFVSLSYKDDDEYKAEAIKEFSKPDSTIHGLIATDILTKGFDQADVMIGISARPFSKSFSSHVQQMGRVMRPHHSKESAIWIDFSGNYLRFREQWDELYEIGVTELSCKDKTAKEKTQNEKEASKCPKCGQLWVSGTHTCIHCGYVRVRTNKVEVARGVIEELDQEKAIAYTRNYKENFYHELLGYAHNKGYSAGWAWHKYKEKFGIQPAWKKKVVTPGFDTIDFVRNSVEQFRMGFKL